MNSAHSIVGLADPVGPGHHLGGLGERAAAARRPGPRRRPAPGADHRGAPTPPRDRPARAAGQSSCTVIVNVRDGPGQPWEVSESGSQPLLDGGYLDVSDVERRRSVDRADQGSRTSAPARSSSAAVSSRASRPARTAGDLLPRRAAHPGAGPAYLDGIGPGGIAMYDLERQPAVRASAPREQAQSYYHGETSGRTTPTCSRRSTRTARGRWSAIASDGSMEYAVAPVERARTTANPVRPARPAVPTAREPDRSGHDLGDRLGRVGRQVEGRRRTAAGDELGAERGHHRAVVGAQPGPRARGPGRRGPRPARSPSPGAGSWRRRRRRSGGRRCPGRWRRRAPCGPARRRPPPGSCAATSPTSIGHAVALLGLDPAGDGGLEAGEREVEAVPLEVAPAGQAAREVDGDLAVAGRAVDVGTAGEGQAEQPGDLVERLAGRVVDGGAERLDAPS